MNIIDKEKAKIYTEEIYDDNWIELSITAELYNGIVNQNYHCNWYSPARYDITEEDLNKIDMIVSHLINIGYVVAVKVFKPDKFFPNRKVRININWE